MWTNEQKKIIDDRGRGILVSAAAGSGKTAVLVERILSRVLDKKNPCDIDEFLVVTFTNAAAAQMRDKISARLEEALNEEPDNGHITKQLLLVNRADITTIDSFCLRLVKENFGLLNLDSAFNIGDAGMMDMLAADVLTELFEKKYGDRDRDFLRLLDIFSGGYDDSGLKDHIMSIYKMVSSYPDPEKWLTDAKNVFSVQTEDELISSKWMAEYMKTVKIRTGEALSLVKEGLSICEEPFGPDKNTDVAKADREFIDKLDKACGYRELYSAMDDYGWTRLATCKGDNYDEEKVKKFKNIRDSYKKIINGIILKKSLSDILNEIKDMSEYLVPLINLTGEFIRLYSDRKSKRKLFEFSDIEHMAYRLVCAGCDGDGNAVPTETGKEISERYREIYIDEYQDSNYIQEDILCSVSGLSRGEHNMFMVGDVKQSIYRFRMARPDLFIKKYNKFSKDGDDIKVELKNNFRSRACVLNAVNFFFYQIMGENLGGISYNEETALVPSKEFPNADGMNISDSTELLIVDKADDKPLLAEARMIAARINEIVDDETGLDVYDGVLGCYRKAKYSDIVILARSIKAVGEIFYNTLSSAGIPVYLDDPQGYFDAVEIKTVLSLLNVVDNVRQDIPLAAVLLSPIGNISENELAVICGYAEKNVPDVRLLIDKCECYILDNEDDISRKLEHIMGIIDELKEDKTEMSISSLIWKAVNMTGYYNYASAMPMGGRRRANIDMLLEKAAAYENGYYKGLFNFLRYIDRLKINSVDFGEAHVLDADENMVNIISMHKSKGLEYPIVFVSGLGRQFNQSDNKSNLIINSDYYIASKVMNEKGRFRKDSFFRDFLRYYIKSENMAEEERVLYVAMTRACEKLILTGYTGDLDRLKEKYEWVEDLDEVLLPYSVRRDSLNFLELIIAGFIRYGKISEKLKTGNIISYKTFEPSELEGGVIKKAAEKGYTFNELKKKACGMKPGDKYKAVKEKLEYSYPYALFTGIRSKMSVSDIKRMKAYDGQGYDADTEFTGNYLGDKREKDGLTGSERGTIVHKFMELIPFEAARSADDIRGYISGFKDELKERSVMDDRELTAVDVKKITQFFESPLGKRMEQAAAAGQLFKEKQFSIGVPVGDIYDTGGMADTDDIILVQGIIDAYFYEDGDIILMDYKTDAADEKTLIGRYEAQLDYYAGTLERLLKRKVKEKIIYSFYLGKEIVAKNG